MKNMSKEKVEKYIIPLNLTHRDIISYLTLARYVTCCRALKVKCIRNMCCICSPRDRIIEVGIYSFRIYDLLRLLHIRLYIERIRYICLLYQVKSHGWFRLYYRLQFVILVKIKLVS